MSNLWKEVLIEKLNICGIYSSTYEDNPQKALDDLIDWHIEVHDAVIFNQWRTQCKESVSAT